MNKLIETLGSSNFLVTIFAIISSIFAYNQVPIEASPADIAASFTNSSTDAMITTIILLFLNPLIKIIKGTIEKGFNFGFLKSSNFWVQVGSAVVLILGTQFDIELINTILITITGNTTNLIVHATQPAKKI